jgi:hypothetical protein
MNKVSKVLAISVVSLLPLPALAAGAAAPASNSNPAAGPTGGELHGFDKYWSMIDKSGKGYITKDEWQARSAEHFNEIDANHDGKITKEEMKTYDQKMFQQRRMQKKQ